MEDRFQFITHQGKRIFFVDCSHCSTVEFEKLLKLLPSYLTDQPKQSVLLLADLTGAQIDKNIFELMKQDAVYDRPYIKKSAWYGTETLPHVFYEHLKNFSQRELPLFKSKEEALDWLVQD